MVSVPHDLNMFPCSSFATSWTLTARYIIQPFMRTFALLFCHMMRQGEVNDMHLQMANGRVPPSWGPEHERTYCFRYYEIDANLWNLASDMDEPRKGPALALRLTGGAKMIIRELDPNILVNGQMIVEDGQQVRLTGVQALLRILRRRYAPLDQEAQLHAVSEFFSFSRQPHEDTDQVVARFEVVCYRARDVGGAQMNEVILSWMLLHHLRIPKDRWPLILTDTQGSLPADAPQYQAFLLYLRRNGHLYDRGNDGAKNVSGHNYFVDSASNTNMDSPFAFHTSSALSHAYPVYPDGLFYDDQSYPVFDNETLSSGNSRDESAIDLSDLAGLPYNQAVETVYAGFRMHKRRWRKFAGPRKFGKGKGKGKRKGGKKGKSGKGFPTSSFHPRPTFFGDETEHSWNEWVDPTDDSTDWDQSQVYAMGKGKGKRRGNPVGRDGKVMLCSGCNSPDHFIAECPAKGKGKSSSFITAENWTTPQPGPSASASSQPTPPRRGVYMAVHDVQTPVTNVQEQCTISFMDGTPSVSFDSNRARTYMNVTDESNADMPVIPKQAFFPWWKTEIDPSNPNLNNPSDETQVPCYHGAVRLTNDREGLVIDTGAVLSLSGDHWVHRNQSIGEKYGHGTAVKQLDRPFGIEGVGQGSNSVKSSAVVPIAMQHGIVGTFSTNVVDNSPIPALCGLNPMIEQRTILDLVNGKMVLLGGGGYNLNLSPGSVVFDLERAPTGHLILPTSEWVKAQKTSKKGIALLAL